MQRPRLYVTGGGGRQVWNPTGEHDTNRVQSGHISRADHGEAGLHGVNHSIAAPSYHRTIRLYVAVLLLLLMSGIFVMHFWHGYFPNRPERQQAKSIVVLEAPKHFMMLQGNGQQHEPDNDVQNEIGHDTTHVDDGGPDKVYGYEHEYEEPKSPNEEVDNKYSNRDDERVLYEPNYDYNCTFNQTPPHYDP